MKTLGEIWGDERWGKVSVTKPRVEVEPTAPCFMRGASGQVAHVWTDGMWFPVSRDPTSDVLISLCGGRHFSSIEITIMPEWVPA